MKQKRFLMNMSIGIGLCLLVSASFFACSYNVFLAGGNKTSLKNVLTTNTLDLVYQLNSKNVLAQLAASAAERKRILRTINILIEKSGREDKMRATMGAISIYSKATVLNQVIGEDTSATILKLVKGDLPFSEDPRKLMNELFKNAKKNDIDKIMDNAITNYGFVKSLGEDIESNNNKFPEGTTALEGDYAEQAIIVATLYQLSRAVTVAGTAGTEPPQSVRVAAIKDYVNNSDSIIRFGTVLPEGKGFEGIFGTTDNPNPVGSILIGAKLESLLNAF